jgi:peptidoglycan/xylan/chitin deacetylase (PgdA/CDA1 family)/GT2 family glycosyltransferase
MGFAEGALHTAATLTVGDGAARTTVSIVIPCFTARRWTSLMRAVESAWAQTYPCELIVVVDHNDELLVRLERAIGSRALVMANDLPQGASGARNTGALAASSEVVAFLEDDATAEPTWIENLVRDYRRTPTAVGFGGALRPVWLAPVPRWFPAEFSWVVGSTVGRVDRDADVRNVWGGNMLVRRRSFLDAGGFRTGFGKLGTASQPEDTELCIRMSARAGPGARWRFVSDAVAFHKVPAERGTWSFFLRRCWSEGKGKHAVAVLSGSGHEILDEEARFVRTVLTKGVARHLLAVVRGDLFGVARAAAIVLGTAAASVAFGSAAAVAGWRGRSGSRTDPDRLDEPTSSGLIPPPPERHVPTSVGSAGVTARAFSPTATWMPAEPSPEAEGSVRHRHDASVDHHGVRWRLPILMYHSVSGRTRRSVDPLAVPVPEFEEHVARLSSDGWTVVGLTEALALLDAESSRRVVAMTFDDGLGDFLDAFDVLRQYGARATAYIPTGTVGMRPSEGSHDGARLSWSELAGLSEAGVEMGSHSVSHRPLDVLPMAEVTRELLDSKKVLEDHLDVSVASFCYPHGYSSSRVRREVRRAGYANACVVGRRIARSTDDVEALPRLQVRPGATGQSFDELVRYGEPGLVPRVKRGLMPAWRLTRYMSARLLDRQMT